MSYNTAVCFTTNEHFKLIAQSFCDTEDLTLEGCVDHTSNLIRYVKSLKPESIIVDGWHNWHSILETFVNLCGDIKSVSLPNIYVFEDKGFSAKVYRVETNVLQYLLTGHCGLCPKRRISSDNNRSDYKEESVTKCFSCGALDNGESDAIAFLTLPSAHSENSDIVICNECIERIWRAYQRLLKRITLEFINDLDMEDEDGWYM